LQTLDKSKIIKGSVRKPRAPIESVRLPKMDSSKTRKAAEYGMSRDTSSKSFVSVNSISTSEGWRHPSYLRAQGIAELEKLFAVVREELAMCCSIKEVEKVSKAAEKITSGGNADQLNMTGRLAYRFREASRAICNSSSYCLLDKHHQLAFRKVLKCEVRRRQAEIAGWDEKDAEEMALVSFMLQDETQDKHLLKPPPKVINRFEPVLHEAVSGGEKVSSKTIAVPQVKPCVNSLESSLRPTSKSKLPVIEMPESTLSESCDSTPPNGIRARSKESVAMGGRMQSKEVPEKSTPTGEKPALSKTKLEEEKWVKVYHKVREDTGIHQHDIAHALTLVGFSKPEHGWIDEVFKTITKYITIREDEWIRFVRGYLGKQSAEYRTAFEACDEDCSGEVEISELAGLLRKFGINPLEHVLQEVIDEVDTDGTGALNFEESQVVIDLLKMRAGFSKNEYEELVDLFHKFDRDKSGEIDTQEIYSVMSWLGYAWKDETVEEIIKIVDLDGSGQLNQSEFLTCMGKMRENELKLIREAMDDHDDDGNGLIAIGELRYALSTLGYHVDMEACLEAGRDAGVVNDIATALAIWSSQTTERRTGSRPTVISKTSAAELDISQLWRLLVVYRSREGFSAAESNDIKEAFERYDKENRLEVNSVEIGKILRWLGYCPAFELQQQLVKKVDSDDSGKLSLPEVRKLVRMLQEKERDFIVETFMVHAESKKPPWHHYGELLWVENADLALRDAGCVDTKGLTPTIPENELVGGDDEDSEGDRMYLTLEVFVRIANKFNKSSRRAFRENSGFSRQEIEAMQEYFESYDRDGSGDISTDELVCLIEDVLPDLAHDASMRPKLASLMRECDADSSGSLDFQDFLRLMQQLQELKMQERITKEYRAAQDCCFSTKEVEEFRELFLSSEDGSGFLSFAMLQQMLRSICPLGDRNLSELSRLIQGVVTRTVEAGAVPSVDFPEFLRVMRKLWDTNFAGLHASLGGRLSVTSEL